MITQNEAQQLHEQRQANEPEHDDIGCWCCCLTCDFDTKFISDFNDPDETTQILADPQVMADLKASEEAIARGETLSAQELAEDLRRLGRL